MKPTIMLPIFSVVALLATVTGQTRPTGPVQAPKSLALELVKALNSKDIAVMRSTIQKLVISNVPVEQRADRWMQLADRGAPFKIVRDLKQTEGEIDVVIVDKVGARIALTIHYEAKPKLMMRGFQLAPAFMLEGSSPELAGWTDINSLAKKISAQTQSPGMGIAVARNGVVMVGVAGIRKVKGNDPVKPNDPWSIGSIGKPICSTLIGRLIEEGKLRWDETLKQALPNMSMDSGYSKVTIEQVMHHRGGIPQDLGFEKPEVLRIIGNAATATAIRERYARDILSRKPISAPNEQFAYSNAGYALLSYIAERTIGKPYELLVKEIIFNPLGLRHSFTGADALPAGKPVGHSVGPKGLEAGDVTGAMEDMFAGAGGGMFMSVGDLATFGEAHLKGLRGQNGLLRAATIERLQKGIQEEPGGSRLYACGWGIESLPGVETFHGHNGSNGTMRAQLAIFPKSNLVVVGVVNRGGEEEPSPGMQAVLAVAERWARR